MKISFKKFPIKSSFHSHSSMGEYAHGQLHLSVTIWKLRGNFGKILLVSVQFYPNSNIYKFLLLVRKLPSSAEESEHIFLQDCSQISAHLRYCLSRNTYASVVNNTWNGSIYASLEEQVPDDADAVWKNLTGNLFYQKKRINDILSILHFLNSSFFYYQTEL